MKQKLEQRLKALKAEFASGQKMLAEVEARQVNLHTTLLRISGAIQVIEEELAKENGSSGEGISALDVQAARAVVGPQAEGAIG